LMTIIDEQFVRFKMKSHDLNCSCWDCRMNDSLDITSLVLYYGQENSGVTRVGVTLGGN